MTPIEERKQLIDWGWENLEIVVKKLQNCSEYYYTAIYKGESGDITVGHIQVGLRKPCIALGNDSHDAAWKIQAALTEEEKDLELARYYEAYGIQ